MQDGQSELRDDQWAFIQPLLPKPKRTGRHRADDRETLEGILYMMKTGCRWRDLPRDEYGAYSTCWARLRQWESVGVWEHIWQVFLSTLTEQDRVVWTRAFLSGNFLPSKKGGTYRRSRIRKKTPSMR